MDVEKRLEEAITAERPLLELGKVVQGLLERGWEREELVAALESYRADLLQAGREEESELILDVLDSLTGWCSPGLSR